MSALRKWLFTGLLVIVPGVITIAVLNWIVGTLDQTLQILPLAWHPDKVLGSISPALACCWGLLARGPQPVQRQAQQIQTWLRWLGRSYPRCRHGNQ